MSALFAAAPALPLHSAGKYVAGAYVVFVAILLVYVAIMAVRLSRNERDIAELRRDLEAKQAREHGSGTQPESDRETEPVA
jgi:Na+/melibiose symporter-like transporter